MDNNFENKQDEQTVENEAEVETAADTVETEPSQNEETFTFKEESFTAQKIYIPKCENSVPETERKGLRVFCLILALTLALSCFAVGGYFLGKNSVNDYLGAQVDLGLQSKPENAKAGSASQVYSEVSESVVGIYIYNTDGSAYDASGLVYTEDGYIVTTDSIYTSVPAAKFKVYTADGNEYSATFVAGDSRSDISVLKITENVKLTPVTLGDSSQTLTGEKVYSVGHANGYSVASTVSEGIVSASSVRVSNSVTSYSSKMIQTTAGVNPGDFGGALANEYGQVIGMLATKVVSSGYEGTAYAIPSVYLKTAVEALIANGKVADRARIGISYVFVNSADAEIDGLAASGLLVAEVVGESELYGAVKENDIITRINDIKITSDDVVLDVIEKLSPGDTIVLTVVNADGNAADHTVRLLAYEGSSSYSDVIGSGNSDSSGGGTFDFPEGY